MNLVIKLLPCDQGVYRVVELDTVENGQKGPPVCGSAPEERMAIRVVIDQDTLNAILRAVAGVSLSYKFRDSSPTAHAEYERMLASMGGEKVDSEQG